MVSGSLYTSLFQTKDDSFQIDHVNAYDLYLEIGMSLMRIGVIEAKSNRYLFIEDYEFVPSYTWDGVKAILETKEWLKSKKWNQVKISFLTEKYSLVPTSLVDENQLESYLKPLVDINYEKEKIFSYKLKKDFTLVFLVPRLLQAIIEDSYLVGQVHWIPHTASLLQLSFHFTKEYESKSFFLYVEKSIVSMVVVEGEKVLLTNVFHYTSSHELLFYIMFICAELKISSVQDYVYLSGDLSMQLISKLKTYFEKVEVMNRPSVISYSHFFDRAPHHQYITLAGISFC